MLIRRSSLEFRLFHNADVAGCRTIESKRQSPMHQHWVPASYLRAWCDPTSLHLKDPYVWRFSRDGSEVRKKLPKNLFRESDMYTFVDKDGKPNQTIEQGLSRLEDQFERMRRDKIMRCEPLTDEDKATLCLFVATAHFRTQKSRDHWKRQWGELVELGDRIKAHVESLSSGQKAALKKATMAASGSSFPAEEIRSLAEQRLRLLPLVTTREAELLSYMTVKILCTSDSPGFITSDAPVVWFDPELYKLPPFWRHPGLGSETIEVACPLHPGRLLLLTHGGISETYLRVLEVGMPLPDKLSETGMHLIDEINRRTRFHCDEHFLSKSSQRKDIWFDAGTPPPGAKISRES
jgi:hypothetical protein